MATKVFDVFIEGDKVATGTIEELMDIFKVSKTAVSLWIKNGKILVLEPHGNSFTAVLEDSKWN